MNERSAPYLYNSNMRAMRSNSAIKVYNLFEEPGNLLDVVHCKTITARSVLQSWVVSVHRLRGCNRCS
jgi:hypothetical protein